LIQAIYALLNSTLKLVCLKDGYSHSRKTVNTRENFVVSHQVVTNPCRGLAVIFYGFISLLIGRETINIPDIFSGVHGFMGMTVMLTQG